MVISDSISLLEKGLPLTLTHNFFLRATSVYDRQKRLGLSTPFHTSTLFHWRYKIVGRNIESKELTRVIKTTSHDYWSYGNGTGTGLYCRVLARDRPLIFPWSSVMQAVASPIMCLLYFFYSHDVLYEWRLVELLCVGKETILFTNYYFQQSCLLSTT